MFFIYKPNADLRFCFLSPLGHKHCTVGCKCSTNPSENALITGLRRIGGRCGSVVVGVEESEGVDAIILFHGISLRNCIVPVGRAARNTVRAKYDIAECALIHSRKQIISNHQCICEVCGAIRCQILNDVVQCIDSVFFCILTIDSIYSSFRPLYPAAMPKPQQPECFRGMTYLLPRSRLYPQQAISG